MKLLLRIGPVVLAVALLASCSSSSGPAGLGLAPPKQNTKGSAVIDPLGRVRLTPADGAKGLAPLPQRISLDALSVKDFLKAVFQSVEEFWTAQLAKLNKKPPNVRLKLPAHGDKVTSACFDGQTLPKGEEDQLAFFCPFDNTIVISQELAKEVDKGSLKDTGLGDRMTKDSGDFAVAYVLAHEYAHAVQYKLGLFDKDSGPSPRIEQHADCWAGVWGHDTITHHTLEDANLSEAVAAAGLVGDYDTNSPGHHGTPTERVLAFLQGYAKAKPSGCQSLLKRRT